MCNLLPEQEFSKINICAWMESCNHSVKSSYTFTTDISCQYRKIRGNEGDEKFAICPHCALGQTFIRPNI